MFTQVFIATGRFYTSVPTRSTICKASNGEVVKAFMENDSLVFESAQGLKTIICAAKNKGGPALNDLPGIAIDNSAGLTKGRIYICWSSEKNGLRNKDVFLSYSDDKGKTWMDPILITYRPNHRAQVMPVITIDLTGTVYILYYDDQNYYENLITNDVYLALSKNGGLKFEHYKLNTEPLKITLNTQPKNYLNLNSENGIVTASWNQSGKSKTPLTHVNINEAFFSSYQKNNFSEITFDKTISFSQEIKITLNSTIEAKLTAAFTKPLLAGFEKAAVKNFKIKSGTNQLVIDTKKLGLQKGNYTLTLYYNGKNDFIWITEE
ncbi:MAG: exo-alpha-sialidase [Bacteroidetes bacterium]|nr:exo-alpha-sialidase [Bacteroidota bacterium]